MQPLSWNSLRERGMASQSIMKLSSARETTGCVLISVQSQPLLRGHL